jgi:hypothetical protein
MNDRRGRSLSANGLLNPRQCRYDPRLSSRRRTGRASPPVSSLRAQEPIGSDGGTPKYGTQNTTAAAAALGIVEAARRSV